MSIFFPRIFSSFEAFLRRRREFLFDPLDPLTEGRILCGLGRGLFEGLHHEPKRFVIKDLGRGGGISLFHP